MSNPNSTRHDPHPDLVGKFCSSCGRYQFFEEFTRIRKDSEARQGTCKSCVRAKQRANPNKYARNLEWIQRKWREDPEWKKSRLAVMSDYRHSRRVQGTLHQNLPKFVDRYVVFERDNFLCKLCGAPMDMSAAPRSPLSPSIDHIVPVSRGGEHTYENTQSAHLTCNMSKGAREAPKTIPQKMEPIQ